MPGRALGMCAGLHRRRPALLPELEMGTADNAQHDRGSVQAASYGPAALLAYPAGREAGANCPSVSFVSAAGDSRL